jgi:endonuclease YncB( thermonuclease family)
VIEAVQVFWPSAGTSLPALGAPAVVDMVDAGTPTVRMPVRMVAVDPPETSARTEARAREVDEEFGQLAEWIRRGIAPVDGPLADFLLPKLDTGKAGSLHLRQGRDAAAFLERDVRARLARPGGGRRDLFVRVARCPFDDANRLQAHLAPTYTPAERRRMPRAERATFNLDLVTHGWAAPHVVYPAIPGPLDLPLLVAAADAARSGGLGIWGDADTLLGHEYRAMARLYRLTRRIAGHQPLAPGEERSWRSRYCADMRTRVLHGPEEYLEVAPEYRLWIAPADLPDAVCRLNLVPAPGLVGAR